MFNPNNQKGTKQYAISFKSPNGNLVGHFNPAPQFLKAIMHKQPEMVTVGDIMAFNDGNLTEYLSKCIVEITNPNEAITPTNIEEY